MYILDIIACNSSEVLNVIYIAKKFINLIEIGVPLLLIILCILDLIKIITGKEETEKKVLKKIGERFLAAIIVFIIFDVVVFIVNIVADIDITGTNCYKKANRDTILLLKAKEEEARKKQDEERKAAYEEKQSKWLAEINKKTESNSTGSIKASGNFIWPAPGVTVITSGVGPRWGKSHNGIDISSGNAYGSKIVASDSGTVIAAVHEGYGGGYGLHVIINHGNGYVTLYGHASEVLVNEGDKVSQGQTIAYIGSTGNSTGPHLHFEIRKNGTIVDPEDYVKP